MNNAKTRANAAGLANAVALANETVLEGVRQLFNPFLLVLLLAADGAFLLIHVCNELSPRMHYELLNIGTDGGYPEIFQYIKEYWIAILLFAVLWRTREGIYGAWAALFAYLLCDDALSIHENAGELVASYLNLGPAMDLRAVDFGELAVSVAAGVVFLVPATFYYFRSSDDTRRVSRDLVLLLGVLVFFGVFFDMLHVAVATLLQVKNTGLGTVEDGGEMVTMSIIASYVARLQQRQVAGSMSLWQLAKAVLPGRRGH